jgi:hypothetical protein
MNANAIAFARFKKDMWEKISKEMQIPWRAAEAMHWQLGEVEMAQRANVAVFHLAGQQAVQQGGSSGLQEQRIASVSPPSAIGVSYSHTHNHSLPQIPMAHPAVLSPVQTRLRRNSSSVSPTGPPAPLRRRTDSGTSMSAASLRRGQLPSVADVVGPSQQSRYTLPPVPPPPADLFRR